mmetsp:Transcript_5045/g.7708  ORF Transcript_5045/g.7708 Transcript_5045/m.7708 type:complete len:769 (-) Transcript_5045:242-2548(-)|eukprot:CAMPEP_0185033750 /NCGR_PEP_ID=MMETSP1103-20130426/23018_1 /TAXON_ID=36769 /ORGANISM="Paraphysomonas bandaiensis, Strain Caron Lab Isolate" /LENGTH=768 /DNA_ID=CAMNT_0027570141 /DNA_START=158 /DNA_END=2464 /DNA_ORIENTATION=-
MDFSSPDGWRKVKVIGRGGSSTVYEVDIVGTDLVVAAKEIHIDGLTKDQVLAIEAEIDTMKSLQHQNIVNYLGTQRQENYFYIFLEYADMGSLRQLYQNRGALSEHQAALCTWHILNGLSYLHSNGIAHRDIKGANVLLTHKGEPKLADFGASKRFDTASIVSGLKGTPHWMAPEVIKGTQMTTGWMKADVWSLGCTVVEMLTGDLPFSEFENPMTAMYHIANGMSPPLRDVPVSDHARTFVAACTTVDPFERPSVDELLHHPFLASCSAGEFLSLDDCDRSSDVHDYSPVVDSRPPPPPEEVTCKEENPALDRAITIDAQTQSAETSGTSLESLQAQNTPQIHKTRKTRPKPVSSEATSTRPTIKTQHGLPPRATAGNYGQSTQSGTRYPTPPQDPKASTQHTPRSRKHSSNIGVREEGNRDKFLATMDASNRDATGDSQTSLIAQTQNAHSPSGLDSGQLVAQDSSSISNEIDTLAGSLERNLGVFSEENLQRHDQHNHQEHDNSDNSKGENDNRVVSIISHTAPNRGGSSLTESGDGSENWQNEDTKLDDINGPLKVGNENTISNPLRPIAPLSSQKLSLCSEPSTGGVHMTKGKSKSGLLLVKKDAYPVHLKHGTLAHSNHALHIHPHDKHQLNSKPLKPLRKRTKLRSKSANVSGGGSSIALPPMERQPNALRALKNPMIPQLQLRVIQSAPSVSRSVNLPPILSSKTPNKLQSTAHNSYSKCKRSHATSSSPRHLGTLGSQGLTGVCKMEDEKGGILAPRKG